MAKQEQIFKTRVMERMKMSENRVNALWDLFDPFKGYGFNKAHAMSYARVAYQTAYMKANFPAQYMAAHLSATAGEIDTVAELIHEAKQIGLTILAPDLNKSGHLFTTEKNNTDHEYIRIGLSTIKQVGHAMAKTIVEEREKNGPYSLTGRFLYTHSSIPMCKPKKHRSPDQSRCF